MLALLLLLAVLTCWHTLAIPGFLECVKEGTSSVKSDLEPSKFIY